MSDLTVTEIPTKTNKVLATVKKFTPTKSQLKAAAVGAGIALTGAAVAVVFALKRQDESDFDDEFETPVDEDSDTIVIHEN